MQTLIKKYENMIEELKKELDECCPSDPRDFGRIEGEIEAYEIVINDMELIM